MSLCSIIRVKKSALVWWRYFWQICSSKFKGGFFSEMLFLDLQISKKIIPKNYFRIIFWNIFFEIWRSEKWIALSEKKPPLTKTCSCLRLYSIYLEIRYWECYFTKNFNPLWTLLRRKIAVLTNLWSMFIWPSNSNFLIII